MTVTPIRTTLAVESADLEAVTFDGYKDVHKGIRSELFGVTVAAGNVDPGDREALAAHNERLRTLVRTLISHAEHEDTFVQPAIEIHAAGAVGDHQSRPRRARGADGEPRGAERSGRRRGAEPASLHDAPALPRTRVLHGRVPAAPGGRGARGLAGALTGDGCGRVDRHQPGDRREPHARGDDDRVLVHAPGHEHRGPDRAARWHEGGRAAEVFAGVWRLVQSVLEPADFAALAARLEVAA